MIKRREKNFKRVCGLEVINTIKFSGKTCVMLASNSQFFLDGISNIIKGRTDNIRVITEVSEQRIKRRLIKIKPQFLLLDNRSFRLNVYNLLSFIADRSLDTKVILLGSYTEYESNLSNVIYINREMNSSELINIINREILCEDEQNGIKKSSLRLLCRTYQSR